MIISKRLITNCEPIFVKAEIHLLRTDILITTEKGAIICKAILILR